MNVLKENWLWFVVAFVIVVVLGITITLRTEDTYKSSFQVYSSVLDNQFLEAEMLYVLQLVKDGNISALTEELQIDKATAEGFRDLRAKPNFAEKSLMELEIFVGDKTYVEPIVEALTNYIRNHPFNKERVDIEKQHYDALIEKSAEELGEIDAVQDKMKEKIESGSNIAYPDQAHYEAYQISEKLETHKKEKAEVKLGEVIVKPYEPAGLYAPNYKLNTVITLFAAFVVGIAAALGAGLLKVT